MCHKATSRLGGSPINPPPASDFAEPVELLFLPGSCAGSRTFTGSCTCAPHLTPPRPPSRTQFTLLQMKTRSRKAVEIAHMIVMQMGQNDIFYRVRIDAERREPLHGTSQECALALLRYFRVEAGIDDKGSTATLCYPHEVIHRHRPIMRIAAD